MSRHILLLFLLAVTVQFPVMSAPAAVPEAAITNGIEPVALAKLDEAARSYAALQSLSFVAKSRVLEGETREFPTLELAFKRPYFVRWRTLTSDKAPELRAVGDGKMVWARQSETVFVQESLTTPPATPLATLFHGTDALFLIPLLEGQNPLTADLPTEWKSAVLRDGAVVLTTETDGQ